MRGDILCFILHSIFNIRTWENKHREPIDLEKLSTFEKSGPLLDKIQGENVGGWALICMRVPV